MIIHIPFLFSRKSSMPLKIPIVDWPKDTDLITRLLMYPKQIGGLKVLAHFIDEKVIFTQDPEDIISRKMFRLRLIDYAHERGTPPPTNVQLGWLFSYAGIKSRAVGGRGNQSLCYCGLKWRKKDRDCFSDKDVKPEEIYYNER